MSRFLGRGRPGNLEETCSDSEKLKLTPLAASWELRPNLRVNFLFRVWCILTATLVAKSSAEEHL